MLFYAWDTCQSFIHQLFDHLRTVLGKKNARSSGKIAGVLNLPAGGGNFPKKNGKLPSNTGRLTGLK